MVDSGSNGLKGEFLVTYRFVYYAKDETIDFSVQEKRELIGFFPKINFTNIVKLGPATGDLVLQNAENNKLPEICAEYGCDVKDIAYAEIEINGTKTLRQIPIDFCDDPRFHCFKYKAFSLNYNCIGWALGIREWVNPRFYNQRIVQKSNIGEFISEVKAKYPENHPKNIIPILNKLEVMLDFCPPKKGILFDDKRKVAFYFKNDQLQHAARYLTALDEKEINSWTSKLGAGLLVSHNLEDLSGAVENLSYGMVECFGTINLEPNIDKEL